MINITYNRREAKRNLAFNAEELKERGNAMFQGKAFARKNHSNAVFESSHSIRRGLSNSDH